jgi:hypothetical protein
MGHGIRPQSFDYLLYDMSLVTQNFTRQEAVQGEHSFVNFCLGKPFGVRLTAILLYTHSTEQQFV